MIRKFFSFMLLGLFSILLVAPMQAQQDAVQFGSDIRVTKDHPAKDAVCFFCSVKADEEIHHDTVVFFGNVHLKANVGHDVVVFFGNITADDNVVLGGDVVNFFGSVHLGQGVHVERDLVVMFGSLKTAETATIGRDHVIFPFWLLLIPIAILGLIIWGFVSLIRNIQYRRQIGYPLPPMQ